MRLFGSLALALTLAASGAAAQAPATSPTVPDTSATTSVAGTSAAIGSAESLGQAPTTLEHVAEQGHAATAAQQVDIITPHITDSKHIEYPCLNTMLVCEAELPQWAPISLGGLQIDMSPTKHVVMLLLASLLACLVLITAAQAHTRHTHAIGRPKGFAAGIESMVLYIRNEVALPNLGHHGEGFVPFILTLFFFILFANLLGLIPYGSTATGNISVTATLALITIRRHRDRGHAGTGRRLPEHDLLLEQGPADHHARPDVRHHDAGRDPRKAREAVRARDPSLREHDGRAYRRARVDRADLRLQELVVAARPLLLAVAIMLLELFVAFLQAFIFSLLASVFIGQIREAHH